MRLRYKFLYAETLRLRTYDPLYHMQIAQFQPVKSSFTQKGNNGSFVYFQNIQKNKAVMWGIPMPTLPAFYECIPHGTFFFCICKYSLNSLTSQWILPAFLCVASTILFSTACSKIQLNIFSKNSSGNLVAKAYLIVAKCGIGVSKLKCRSNDMLCSFLLLFWFVLTSVCQKGTVKSLSLQRSPGNTKKRTALVRLKMFRACINM